jgi:regulator of sigma E protease
LSHIAALPVWGMVFWGVITFSILVFIHEGAHFLAARAFGVKVHEFMLGLPGPALRFHTKATTFGITAIPFGGYVRIAGMEPGAEDELLASALAESIRARRIDATALAAALGIPLERASSLLVTLADYGAIEAATDDKVSYLAKTAAEAGERPADMLARVRAQTYRGRSTWQRIVILSAGVVVNIVAAILIFTIVLTVYGYPTPTLVLGQVLAGGAAKASGLTAGDRLTAIDGVKVASWDDVLAKLRAHKPGDAIVVTYVRDGATHEARAVLGKNGTRAFLGVGAAVSYQRSAVLRAFGDSLKLTGEVFVAIWQFFANVVHPARFVAGLKDARSVVGIAELASQQAQAGPLDYAWFVALLSLSLGVMNILPIPPLDGGKVAMEIGERIAGRPLRREWSLGISLVGTALLFTLIGYLVYADIVRVASGH